MSKMSESERKKLEKNPNVLRIKDTRITYNPEFKINAVKAYLSGQYPEDIFLEAGFDLSSFCDRYSSRMIRKWNSIYQNKGEEGLLTDYRGEKSKGRPPKKHGSEKEELEYLRMENFLLKKLQALAMLKK